MILHHKNIPSFTTFSMGWFSAKNNMYPGDLVSYNFHVPKTKNVLERVSFCITLIRSEPENWKHFLKIMFKNVSRCGRHTGMHAGSGEMGKWAPLDDPTH
jgi:hypothetical protein